MKTSIIIDEMSNWIYRKYLDCDVYFKGIMWIDDVWYAGEGACERICSLLSSVGAVDGCASDVAESVIKTISGHCAFIFDNQEYVIGYVDRVRSYPIFYCEKSGKFFLSNSGLAMRDSSGLCEGDECGILEFLMAGYVSGRKTLYSQIFQIQPGQFLIWDKKAGKVDLRRYYVFFPDSLHCESEEDLLEILDQKTSKVFQMMIETLDGRQAVIPLSGGLDSRLVLAMLHILKYDNVVTFTYGIPKLWEVKRAERIAKILGVKWHYIVYRPKEIKSLYHSSEMKSFLDFSSGLSSVPCMIEVHAIRALKERKIIDDDSIFINGQSGDFLTGGHIPAEVLAFDRSEVEVSQLLEWIIDKHYSLWLDLKTQDNISLVQNRILSHLGLAPKTTLSAGDAAYFYELYEWQERQCKYVVNGQRMYEWFHHDWRLPLWSDELMLFWQNIPWNIKLGQNLYKKYLQQYDPAGLFTVSLPERYSYIPTHLKILDFIYLRFANSFHLDKLHFQRKYLKYFLSNAPYYPQRNYFEYLRNSVFHRNAISYYAKDYIKNLGFTSHYSCTS